MKKLLMEAQHSIKDDDLKEISNVAHGFVGSDLVSLCSRASLYAYKNNQKELEFINIKSALKEIKPSAMREFLIEVSY